MAHGVAPQAETDLDDIWLYVARESGSMDVATRLIDAITGRFLLLATLDDARASLARGEGRVITQESMRELASEVRDRGRARLIAELADVR